MPSIFISYRRNDAGYVAGMLYDRLQLAFGDSSVFIDIDNIPLGVDFRTHLGNAVSKCDILLALIGDNWMGVAPESGKRRIDEPTDFVRIEVESALARNIPVIPVLVGNATIPSADILPEGLKSLAFRNAAELRSGRDLAHHLESLLRGLREHFGISVDNGGSASSEPRPPAQVRDQESSKPASATSQKPPEKVVEIQTASIEFTRLRSWTMALRKIVVGLNGKRVCELSNEGTKLVTVMPGIHEVELSLAGKAMFHSVEVAAGDARIIHYQIGDTGEIIARIAR